MTKSSYPRLSRYRILRLISPPAPNRAMVHGEIAKELALTVML